MGFALVCTGNTFLQETDLSTVTEKKQKHDSFKFSILISQFK